MFIDEAPPPMVFVFDDPDPKVFVKDEQFSFFTYFFCCILNQYLSSSVSINSFVELVLISDKTNKELARWNPTSGRKDLL